MKKLFSLFGIFWLLAFVATPIYAQEEDVVLDDEQGIVAEAEDVDAAVDEFNEEVEAIADDVVAEVEDAEEAVEDTVEDVAEDVENVPSFFDDEEVQKTLGELDLSNEEAAWLAGLFAGMWIAGLLVALVFGILVIIAMWKIFTKAWEAGWLAIIPIVNAYIMYKIAGMKNWFWYTLIVAFVCWLIAGFLWESDIAGYISIAASLFSGIVAIVAAYKLPRKFGWGVFASVLYVLFTGICILILGFGNYKYEGKSEETIVEA